MGGFVRSFLTRTASSIVANSPPDALANLTAKAEVAFNP
jgi:hypothetical protein